MDHANDKFFVKDLHHKRKYVRSYLCLHIVLLHCHISQNHFLAFEKHLLDLVGFIREFLCVQCLTLFSQIGLTSLLHV